QRGSSAPHARRSRRALQAELHAAHGVPCWRQLWHDLRRLRRHDQLRDLRRAGQSCTSNQCAAPSGVNVMLRLDASLRLPNVDLGGGPHQVALADFSATPTDASSNVIWEALAADGTGKFGASFLSLMPGSYTLTFSAPGITALTTAPGTPAAVTVTAGP